MTSAHLPFEDWKKRLRDDCALCEKLWAFETLGDQCLIMLWEVGTEPSADALIRGSKTSA